MEIFASFVEAESVSRKDLPSRQSTSHLREIRALVEIGLYHLQAEFADLCGEAETDGCFKSMSSSCCNPGPHPVSLARFDHFLDKRLQRGIPQCSSHSFLVGKLFVHFFCRRMRAFLDPHIHAKSSRQRLF